MQPLDLSQPENLSLLPERQRRCRTVARSGEAASPRTVWVEGVPAVDFCSNDYLGLSQDPRLIEAAQEATARLGTGAGGSRLVGGTTEFHTDLEKAVARWKGAEAALVFNSGYQANVGILQALLAPGDWVFCDRLAHASLLDGVRLSGARLVRYRHLDLETLTAKLKKVPLMSRGGAKPWILTESLFSMDGDVEDLKVLVALARSEGARLMVDEAHAAGVFGPEKRSGWVEACGLSAEDVPLQMGTFSKALGSFGGYVAGSTALIQTLVNRARSFIYSTALPPGVMAANLRAVELVQADAAPTRALWENIHRFWAQVQMRPTLLACFPPSAMAQPTPIIPLVLGTDERALRVSEALLASGFFIQAIRPPSVPEGTARLRITLSAAHTPEEIDGLVAALEACLLG